MSRKRLWVMRLSMVVLAPLLLFTVVELALRVIGVGYPTSFLLPARIQGREVLTENSRFAWRFFGREMARQPYPLVLAKDKPHETVRIFVFGESAAYGDPQPEFGLPRILQVLLSDRFVGTRFEVVNAAMTAINSHAILPIARDCAAQHGDIWVIYMGNNEVVGPYGAGTVFGAKAANLALVRCGLALKSTRVGQCLDGLLRRLGKQSVAKQEWGGMAMFLHNQVRLDDPSMTTVYRNFESNLTEILRLAHRRGVKVVMSTVAANLMDCAPFASLHRRDISAGEMAEWDRFYRQGVEYQGAGRAAEAMASFDSAARIDGTFAGLQFHAGKCGLALGSAGEAAKRLALARDLDVLRFRADSRINEIITRAASAREADWIRLADGQAALAKQSPDGILGKEFLYEHVHLNFEGNYLLARTLADEIARLLPSKAAQGRGAADQWPTILDCARRLAWTDWSRREAESAMLSRIAESPFTAQSDHAEIYRRLANSIHQLAPQARPAALREVVSRCREAITLAPEDWVLQKILATVQMRLSDFAGAVESWKRVAASIPQSVEVWQDLAQALAQDKREDEAIVAFQHALQLDRSYVPAVSGMAQVLASQGRNAEARHYFEQVLKIKPYWSPAHIGLGKILESTGEPSKALPHFRAALTNRMYTAPALNALARLCFEKGWLSEAATNFTDALRLDPSDATAHLNFGLTLASMGRRAEAAAQYAEAVQLDPTLPEARVRLGVELGREGKDSEAMEQFAEAARLKPSLMEARLNLGISLLHQRRDAEALDQFLGVLKEEPTNAIALKYVQTLNDKLSKTPK